MDYELPGFEGWMSEPCLRWLYAQAGLSASVVEVGSWKGLSTHALLSGCKGPVFAVDHFLGSPNERGNSHAEAVKGDIYGQFIKNVGKFPNLNVLRMDSRQAASFFVDGSVDMVFIDASHTYEDVKADIEAWRPKCRKVLCGHDAGMDGVTRALVDCGVRPEIVPNTSIWRIDIGV